MFHLPVVAAALLGPHLAPLGSPYLHRLPQRQNRWRMCQQQLGSFLCWVVQVDLCQVTLVSQRPRADLALLQIPEYGNNNSVRMCERCCRLRDLAGAAVATYPCVSLRKALGLQAVWSYRGTRR